MRIKCSLSIPVALLVIVVLVVIFGVISGNAVGAAESEVQISYQKHEQGTAISRYEITETTHMPVYGCTGDDCAETYNGNTEPHSMGSYINNGNGTHSASCSKCNYTMTESHTNGINSNCSKCNYVVVSVANRENQNLGNSGNDNININVQTDNVNTNNTSNESSNNKLSTDKTQADESIPQTGVNSVVIISSILGFVILATMTGIQTKKYKGI